MVSDDTFTAPQYSVNRLEQCGWVRRRFFGGEGLCAWLATMNKVVRIIIIGY